MYSLYVHVFPNNKLYIGISDNIKNRWRKNGNGYNTQLLMYRAIQKYGWNNIKHIVLLENLTKEEACECEKYLIAKYKTNQANYGYNVCIGGEVGPLGIAKSNETREKLRQANLGRHHTAETIEKIKKNHAHYNKGRKISEEQKQKISKANKGKTAWNKGKKLSKEYREKLSKAHLGKSPGNKGVPCSEETKRKLSIANKGKSSWCKGLHLSETTKTKISQSLKNRIWVNNGTHRTLVNADEVQAYLDQGYVLGRGHKNSNDS